MDLVYWLINALVFLRAESDFQLQPRRKYELHYITFFGSCSSFRKKGTRRKKRKKKKKKTTIYSMRGCKIMWKVMRNFSNKTGLLRNEEHSLVHLERGRIKNDHNLLHMYGYAFWRKRNKNTVRSNDACYGWLFVSSDWLALPGSFNEPFSCPAHTHWIQYHTSTANSWVGALHCICI